MRRGGSTKFDKDGKPVLPGGPPSRKGKKVDVPDPQPSSDPTPTPAEEA